jgi:CheY-like chemotaxis protein
MQEKGRVARRSPSLLVRCRESTLMTQPFEVLLVEDNEGDVEMVRQALRDTMPACNLSVASDGTEALDCLFKQGNFRNVVRPNLILLDLNMPRMDGKEALKVIKGDDRVKAIPVVIFTSSASPSDIQESYAHHANCYVVKPFDGDEFRIAITDVVSFWRDLALHPSDATTARVCV